MTTRRTLLGMPIAEFRALALEDCTRCGRPAAEGHCGENHPQRDKAVLCDPCITKVNAAIDAQPPAPKPPCVHCAQPATRRMGSDVDLCAADAKRAQRLLTTSWLMPRIPVTRETVLAALRGTL